MIDNLKAFFNLVLMIIVSMILNNFFAWYISLGLAILLIIVLPPFINVFYFQSRKLKNLPDVDAMPDEILNSKGVTSWEVNFCNDMNEKFSNKEFVENITRKQCRKLIEIYLERVRKIPEKEIDVSKAEIHIGDRKIQ